MSYDMTEEQKALLDKLPKLARKVCINKIAGMSNIDAYYAADGKAKTKSTAEVCVCEILNNPRSKAFLNSMDQAAVVGAVMTRQEMLERLSNLARVNMSDLVKWNTARSVNDDGEVEEQSTWTIRESAMLDELKMAAIAEVSVGRDGLKIKQHSPLGAMKQLADIEGYNSPTEVVSTNHNIVMTKEEYKAARDEALKEDDC